MCKIMRAHNRIIQPSLVPSPSRLNGSWEEQVSIMARSQYLEDFIGVALSAAAPGLCALSCR